MMTLMGTLGNMQWATRVRMVRKILGTEMWIVEGELFLEFGVTKDMIVTSHSKE